MTKKGRAMTSQDGCNPPGLVGSPGGVVAPLSRLVVAVAPLSRLVVLFVVGSTVLVILIWVC